jgi:hypothetical protein
MNSQIAESVWLATTSPACRVLDAQLASEVQVGAALMDPLNVQIGLCGSSPLSSCSALSSRLSFPGLASSCR